MAVIRYLASLRDEGEDFSEAHLHCFFYVVVRGAVQGSRACGMVFGPLAICFLEVRGNSGLWMWTSMALESCSPWTDVLERVMAKRPWPRASCQRLGRVGTASRSDFSGHEP